MSYCWFLKCVHSFPTFPLLASRLSPSLFAHLPLCFVPPICVLRYLVPHPPSHSDSSPSDPSLRVPSLPPRRRLLVLPFLTPLSLAQAFLRPSLLPGYQAPTPHTHTHPTHTLTPYPSLYLSIRRSPPPPAQPCRGLRRQGKGAWLGFGDLRFYAAGAGAPLGGGHHAPGREVLPPSAGSLWLWQQRCGLQKISGIHIFSY